MEETSLINNLSIMLLAMINAGGLARLAYCNVVSQTSEETRHSMKKRKRNIIVFLIVANSIFSIQAALRAYWG